MTHRRASILALLVALAAIRFTGAGGTAHAQSTAAATQEAKRARNLGDLQTLLGESVVTTASKSAESASVAPAQILNITAEQMRIFGIRTVAEALNFLGVGMYAAGTGETLLYAGVDTQIGSRGVMFADGGSRVLVLLDGHTTNSQIDGRSWVDDALGVPIEIIDHIEVVLGPGSVMYGSSAFLGVINVVTRRARDLPGLRATAAVTLQPPQAASGALTAIGNGDSLGVAYRLALSFGREFTLFHSKAELVAQAEWLVGSSGSYRVGPQYGSYSQGYLPVGTTPWQGSEHGTINAPALVSTLRVGDFRLGLHLNSHDRTAPLAGTLGLAGNQGNTRHFGLDLGHIAQIGDRFTLSSRLYLDATQQSQLQVLATADPPEFPLGLVLSTQRLSQWLGLEEVGIIDWRSNGSLVTTIGFDARGRRSQAVEDQKQDPVTGVPSQLEPAEIINAMTALGGVYLQQIYRPWPWLDLNAGLRLDLDQLFGYHLSPRAAAAFTPWSNGTLKLMYAEAFRAPTPVEVDEYTLYAQIKPTGLQPEVLRSIELELSQGWPRGRAALNGFFSLYDDMISSRPVTAAEYAAAVAAGQAIAQVPAGAFTTLANLGQMRGYGGSLSLEERLPAGLRLALNVLVSNTLAQNQTGATQTLLFTPSWFGNARLSWQPRADGFSLGFAFNLLGPRSPYLASYTPSPPIVLPTSADLRLTASLPMAPLRGLAVRLIGDYDTCGLAPLQIGGPVPGAPATQAELIPLPRAFFLAEIRYEH